MVSQVELYDAFGELMYAVANADGVIDEQEVAKLKDILKDHEWASEILWSFNYEKSKRKDIKTAYHKALDVCKTFGPSKEYIYLLDALAKIAAASDGISAEEKEIIDNFEADLRAQFRADLLKDQLIIRD